MHWFTKLRSIRTALHLNIAYLEKWLQIVTVIYNIGLHFYL